MKKQYLQFLLMHLNKDWKKDRKNKMDYYVLVLRVLVITTGLFQLLFDIITVRYYTVYSR